MTLEDLNKLIEKNNLIFDQLSPAEKRVAIAEDCITRIKIKQIEARQGSFIRESDFYGGIGFHENGDMFKKPNYMEQYQNEVKDIINSSPITCSACAKGALFISYVGRVNNVNRVYDSVNIDNAEHKKLLELFSAEQLSLIELAFEGYQYLTHDENHCRIQLDLDVRESARELAYSITDTNERLIAICENIIENKGEFIPSTSLKV